MNIQGYIFILMMICLVVFIGCAFSVPNSIEANESDKTKDRLSIITGISFIVGGASAIALMVLNFINN